jgi:hypothetical protein
MNANALSGWLEILLAASAMAMASALPQWQLPIRRNRPVPLWLPLTCLFGFATASTMAGIMLPELLAAAFAEA